MLGSDLWEAMEMRGFQAERPTLEELDVTDPNSVAEAVSRGWDWVVNCAAYTAVDRAESERDLAISVNGLAPGYLARACVIGNAKFLHVSTDFVFDGKKSNPYVESDRTQPLGAYGYSKHLGEDAVMASGARSWIVRTSWLYGPNGNSFPRTMIQAARAGKSLRVVADQTGTPTYTADLARVILDLMTRPTDPGVYHAAGPDVMTWHRFAELALAAADLQIEIEPIATKDWPTPAPRPAYSALSFEKCLACGIEPMRKTEEALKEFVARMSAS